MVIASACAKLIARLIKHNTRLDPGGSTPDVGLMHLPGASPLDYSDTHRLYQALIRLDVFYSKTGYST